MENKVIDSVFDELCKMSRSDLKKALNDMLCDELHLTLQYARDYDFDPLEETPYCFKYMWE